MKKRGNNKKAQEVMGMSFGVIFSILLIIFFIAAAFIVIKSFLGPKDSAQIGLFIKDIQGEVDKAWYSDHYTNDRFKSSVPSGITHLCFANISKNPTSGQGEFYSDFQDYPEDNMFLYPLSKSSGMGYVNLNHINISKITINKNPYCIPIDNGAVEMKIEKGFNERLVNIK